MGQVRRWLIRLGVGTCIFLGGAGGAVLIRGRPHQPSPLPVTHVGWLHRRAVESFAEIPTLPGATVFLGDSLIAEGPWSEFLAKGPVLNRGVKGDTVAGVRARLDEVTGRQPARIVLLIGINDLIRGRSAERVGAGIVELVKEMASRCPSTSIVVLSLLPTATAELNVKVRSVNAILRRDGLDPLDTETPLAGPNGLLRSELTYDGLHLTTRGYCKLVEAIQQQ